MSEVVRVAHGDEFRPLRDGIVQLVQVGSPAQFLSEMKRFESHAVVVAEAPDLHVVGRHHHHLIPRRKKSLGDSQIRSQAAGFRNPAGARWGCSDLDLQPQSLLHGLLVGQQCNRRILHADARQITDRDLFIASTAWLPAGGQLS